MKLSDLLSVVLRDLHEDGRTKEVKQRRARRIAAINEMSFLDIPVVTDSDMRRNEIALVNPETKQVIRIKYLY